MKRKILLLCTLLLLVTGALGTFFISQRMPIKAHASGSSDWTMFQGDLGHSGYNGNETVLNSKTASQMKLQWTHKAGGGISSQVTEANGLLYWGSWDGLEHASDPTTGVDLWTAPLGTTTPGGKCYPPSAGPSGAAAIASVPINGTTTSVAFVSGGNATLYALNATTGVILWKTPLGTSPSHMLWAGPVVYNGNVYVGISSYGDCPLIQGQMFQLKASTGTVLKTFNMVPNGCTSGGIWDTPTIDQATGMLYVSTGTQSTCTLPGNLSVGLVELRTTDLSLVSSWVLPQSQWITDSDFGSTPTLFQATIGGSVHQMVGLVNKNGIYYAFDRGNIGAGPLWQVRLSNVGGGNSFASSGWDGSRLYTADSGTTINGVSCLGSIRALNPATGAFLWETCLPNRVESSIMEVPGLVTVGAGSKIIVVDANTGKQLYTFPDPTKSGAVRFVSTATIVNGMLYQGSLDGNLFALGLSTTSTPTPTPSPTGTPTGLFQDNFDSYAPGPLPTGTKTNQWSSVTATGTGFAVGVSTAQANSAPNSLQFTMGSGLKGTAWVLKKYATSTTTHAAHFALYLDPTLTLNGQTISLFQAQNRSNTKNGSVAVELVAGQTLQVSWYDSLGKKHSAAASTQLSAGQWYTIELDQANDPANGSWSLYLNGTQIAGQSGIDTGNLPVDACIAGDKYPSTTAMSGSFYEDDIVTATQHIG